MRNFRIGTTILAVVLIAFLASCGGAVYEAGTYTGEGKGHGGTIRLEVSVDKKSITDITIIDNPESDFSLPAINKLIDTAIEKNSGDIDSISGATETSAGVIAAIQSALAKAQTGEAVPQASQKESTGAQDISVDIAVIGSGGAGLSAAIEAKNAGAQVIIIEKLSVAGGNTNYATGGLNAAETRFQEEQGIEDSAELFFEDTMKGGKNINNPELVKVLTSRSNETVDWLTDLGADLSDVGRLGGASVNRTHRPKGGKAVGAHVTGTLQKVAEAAGVEIRLDNKAVALIHKSSTVTGVEVESPEGRYTITAKAVILATGGFGASQEKIVQYKPELKGFGTTNHPGATGDALDLVKGLNVALVDIEQIQTHPTVVPVRNTMITEAVRGNGAILVNRDAERFVSELETRDVVSDAELAQEGETAFLLFDQGVRDSLAAIEKYANSGLLTEGSSLEELATAMDMDAAVLEETVAAYNSYVAAGTDPDYGRANMPRQLTTAPYYMVEVGPAVHHTMGGIKIDTEARVIDKDGTPVPGLYAAGEVTGGVHGANRLGGNAMADITTFGRIAGLSAAQGK
ncbi:flavocytochrome c [Marispirochaeta sp.]|uniref:flavocytochrome c n=1 Tax=Marispirochaeta sp. TaxID=2038653 RepID=UPI0029C75364|nr:flavocytochrome c [Marispirochaeta sp.]